MKLNEKTILAAMAQVFSDHPERFTTGTFARDEFGVPNLESNGNSFSFCAVGFLRQAQREQLITISQGELAQSKLGAVCGQTITFTNDGPNGRERIINAALKASE